jgi:hypothetical protein
MRTGVAIQTSNYDWDNVEFIAFGFVYPLDDVFEGRGWERLVVGGKCPQNRLELGR